MSAFVTYLQSFVFLQTNSNKNIDPFTVQGPKSKWITIILVIRVIPFYLHIEEICELLKKQWKPYSEADFGKNSSANNFSKKLAYSYYLSWDSKAKFKPLQSVSWGRANSLKMDKWPNYGQVKYKYVQFYEYVLYSAVGISRWIWLVWYGADVFMLVLRDRVCVFVQMLSTFIYQAYTIFDLFSYFRTFLTFFEPILFPSSRSILEYQEM